MHKLELRTNIDQAQVAAKALDLFARLSMGQLQVIVEMIVAGDIPMYAQHGAQKPTLTSEMCNIVRNHVESIVTLLGYNGFGHSLGIGNRQIPLAGHRAYEVSRVLVKELAEHRDPEPVFRGSDYDGLRLRYTNDAMPVARVVEVGEIPVERLLTPIHDGLPPYIDGLRVLGYTDGHDYGGVRYHSIKATDFYEEGEDGEPGTELTRTVTHWMYEPQPK